MSRRTPGSVQKRIEKADPATENDHYNSARALLLVSTALALASAFIQAAVPNQKEVSPALIPAPSVSASARAASAVPAPK